MSEVATPIRNYAAFWVFLTGALYLRTDTVALAVMGIAILWSLRSPFHAVQALTVAWYATSFNNGVAFDLTGPVEANGTSTLLSALKIALLSSAFLRVVIARFAMSDAPKTRLAAMAVGYGLTVAMLALISSRLVDVSLFKIVLFVEGMVTCVLAITYALQERRDALFYWFWTALASVVVLSAPLMFLALGVVRNGSGFQGWLNQPQAFGIFIAPVTVMFFSLGFFDRLWPRINIPLAAIAAIETFACLSRNAILAAMLGLFMGIFISFRKDARRWFPAMIISTATIAAVIMLPSTRDFLSTTVRKDQAAAGESVDVRESFNQSRGILIDRAIENFKSEPLTGIGFGVAADPTEMTVVRDPIFGLPISASVEKGVAWVAALEETGLVGIAALGILIWEILAGAARQRSPTGLAMAFAALMTNNGESTFFSFNGQGLIVWLIVIFAYASSARYA